MDLFLKPEFLVNFPKDHTAHTCKYWTSFALALAGISLYDELKMCAKDKEERIVKVFSQFCDRLCDMYKEDMPSELKASRAMLRVSFDQKSSDWTGKGLLRKFTDSVRREIMNDYNPTFLRLFPNGQFPSGTQLPDAILSFRKAMFEEASLKSKSEKMKEMPSSYFPTHFLAFCALGLFSEKPNHIFNVPVVAETAPPLSKQGPSRSEIKALSKEENDSVVIVSKMDSASTKSSKKSLPETSSAAVAISIQKFVDFELAEAVRMKVKETETEAKKEKVDLKENLKTRIALHKEHGNSAEVKRC